MPPLPLGNDPEATRATPAAPAAHLDHHGLPGRWQGRERFVVLAAGFGHDGHHFQSIHAAWRDDPRRSERLVYIALDPPAPPLTPDLHPIDVEDGRVQWLLVPGEAEAALRGLTAQVDACFLAGPWPETAFKRLARLAAPGATLTTQDTSRPAQAHLTRHGFEVESTPAHGPDDDRPAPMVARFAPRFVSPRPAPLRDWGARTSTRHALVIGAGLAGCAAAWALARQGWRTTVLDRQEGPAQETSGNPGGLMHGIFNAPDSLHARWFRAASLLTARLAAPALASGAVAGDLSGFIRLEHRLDAEQAAAQLARVGLPADWVRWAGVDEARRRTGLALDWGGWWHAQAGWLSPGDWSRWLLGQAVSAGLAQFRGSTEVAALQPSHAGIGWQALDAAGEVLAEAPVVVLANAMAVNRLLPDGATPLRLQAVRGQTTRLPADLPGLHPPQQALSGQGYGLTLTDGSVMIGATSQHGDPDPGLRLADQQHNLKRAAGLGLCDPALATATDTRFDGRVGWRATTPDRLPLIGPKQQGLYVFTGLGSRGLTSAALGGQILAAWVTGAPFPVEAALRDALDPAREHQREKKGDPR